MFAVRAWSSYNCEL